MRLAVVVLGLMAGPAWADIAVPSGQVVTLHEMFLEPQDSGETALRLRFLTPQIGRGTAALGYGDVEADFQRLCESQALPALADAGQVAEIIVISMMDRVVAFGASDPAATQFFEQFRHNSASCIWDDF